MTDPKYVTATEPLFLEGPGGSVRAHNPGDRVLADHAKAYGWDKQVAGEDTKAAAEARATSAPGA